jgi:hypothetical protein
MSWESILSSWLIAAVGLVYLWICIENAIKGNMAMAIVFFGYSVANAGLYWIDSK